MLAEQKKTLSPHRVENLRNFLVIVINFENVHMVSQLQVLFEYSLLAKWMSLRMASWMDGWLDTMALEHYCGLLLLVLFLLMIGIVVAVVFVVTYNNKVFFSGFKLNLCALLH